MGSSSSSDSHRFAHSPRSKDDQSDWVVKVKLQPRRLRPPGAFSGTHAARVHAMTKASPQSQLGRVSGLVVFAVAMGTLVLAIALGANAVFNREFGSSLGGEAVHDSAASAPAAGSAPTHAAAP